MKFFQVGGCVRDEIMGVSSKDIDFSAVMEQADIDAYSAHNQFTPFEYMVEYLKGQGFKVFVETPEHLTARAQFPVADGGFDVKAAGGPINPGKKRLTADFVLARKESGYSDGRRPDSVEVGTLMDDLARRDFTMNAIAKGENGEVIDPFNGATDIARGVIEAVGDAQERLDEDALRALRALRFSVTKDMAISDAVAEAMESDSVLAAIRNKISDERIREELNKMFAHDTVKSLWGLADFPALTDAIFSGSVSLEATMKQRKGR